MNCTLLGLLPGDGLGVTWPWPWSSLALASQIMSSKIFVIVAAKFSHAACSSRHKTNSVKAANAINIPRHTCNCHVLRWAAWTGQELHPCRESSSDKGLLRRRDKNRQLCSVLHSADQLHVKNLVGDHFSQTNRRQNFVKEDDKKMH